jgi:hypothetical protein
MGKVRGSSARLPSLDPPGRPGLRLLPAAATRPPGSRAHPAWPTRAPRTGTHGRERRRPCARLPRPQVFRAQRPRLRDRPDAARRERWNASGHPGPAFLIRRRVPEHPPPRPCMRFHAQPWASHATHTRRTGPHPSQAPVSDARERVPSARRGADASAQLPRKHPMTRASRRAAAAAPKRHGTTDTDAATPPCESVRRDARGQPCPVRAGRLRGGPCAPGHAARGRGGAAVATAALPRYHRGVRGPIRSHRVTRPWTPAQRNRTRPTPRFLGTKAHRTCASCVP